MTRARNSWRLCFMSNARSAPLDGLAAAKELLGRAIMDVYGRLHAGALRSGDVVGERDIRPSTPRRYLRHFVKQRTIFEDDARIIGRFGHRQGAILDIGAHWGYLAASFRHAGADGAIVSFEPMRAHHACLRELRRLDPAYDFAPVGLSDRPRSITLYGPVVNGKAIMGLNSVNGSIFNEHHMGHLVSLLGGEIPLAAGYRFQLLTTPLEARRLDDVLASRRLLVLPPFRVDTRRIGVIKIDVEGHEPEVLAGAEFTLATHRPFIMIESGNRNARVASYLASLGYRYAERDGERLAETSSHSTVANGFWFHGERIAEYRAMGLF